jgi:hypothetical protein
MLYTVTCSFAGTEKHTFSKQGEYMKKIFSRLCFSVSLCFFMILPFFRHSVYAAIPDSRQSQPADTVLLEQESLRQNAPPSAGEPQGIEHAARFGSGITAHSVLLYLPNRVFDLLDVFRILVRVGPGISAGVRATRPASAFVGFHSVIYAGLPGPRGKATLPMPVGLESRGGAQASVVDLSSGNTYYDPLEVGFELQPFIAGFNIGIGLFEILDFATGFVFIDLQDDDF